MSAVDKTEHVFVCATYQLVLAFNLKHIIHFFFSESLHLHTFSRRSADKQQLELRHASNGTTIRMHLQL